MARLTAAGIEPTDLTGYVERLEAAFRVALGSDLNLEPETPQGQLIGVLSLVMAEIDELAVYVAAGLNRQQARGQQLDDYGSLFAVGRLPGQRSRLTATLAGTAGTTIPALARVRTTAGDLFELETAVLIPSAGSVVGTFRSVEFGAVPAAANGLSIVDVVSGWTSIASSTAASLGSPVESDFRYRRRYGGLVAVHGRDSLESVRSRLLETSGVQDALVRDNTTASAVTLQGLRIPAGALLAIVQGGLDADIARAIAVTRPIGTPTTGTTTVSVTHPLGFATSVSFVRVEEIPIRVAIVIGALGPSFPSTGLTEMRANVVAWVAGTWDPAPGTDSFDTGGLGIGEALNANRLLSPLNAVPGHVLTSVTPTVRDGGAALPDPPDLNQRFTLAADDVSFVVP